MERPTTMTAAGAATGPGRPRGRDPVLTVSGLRVDFRTEHGWATVVDDLSFTVGPGEIVGLVGESGSGKSVTSRAVMGAVPSPPGRVAAGSVVLDGVELTGLPRRRLEDLRGDRLAMILQEPMTSLNPAYQVGEQIAEVLRRHRGMSRRQARQEAVAALARVGIPDPATRARAYPHEFSGGMRQRVAIAIALCCQPALLICDEPTTALDVTTQAQILDLIRELRDQYRMAVLFVTHDLGVVADLCDRVLVMYAGQLVEEAPVRELFHHPRHPYTAGLLRSMPVVADRADGLYAVPGQPPVAGAMPAGCRFHPRCGYAEPACQAAPVPLSDTAPGRRARCRRTDELTLTPAVPHD